MNGLTALYPFEKILSVYHIFGNVCACPDLTGSHRYLDWCYHLSGAETAVIRLGHKWQRVSFDLASAPGKENRINQYSLTKKGNFLGLYFPVKGDAPNKNKRKWPHVAPREV